MKLENSERTKDLLIERKSILDIKEWFLVKDGGLCGIDRYKVYPKLVISLFSDCDIQAKLSEPLRIYIYECLEKRLFEIEKELLEL